MTKNVSYGVILDILILHKNIQEELKKMIKALLVILTMIEFPVQEKDFNKMEEQNNICINVFGYENELVYPIFISKQKI